MHELELLRPIGLLLVACQAPAPVASSATALSANSEPTSAVLAAPSSNAAPPELDAPKLAPPPACSPADWAPRTLPALLERGKGPQSGRADQAGAARVMFDAECTDSPNGPGANPNESAEVDGLVIQLRTATPAGSSGRGWSGNQCSFSLRLADGSGSPVELGGSDVPPFNTINAVVRSGSAAWLSIGFNGYAREFPKGGNRVVAVDLCKGSVVWRSKDATSNGGLLLLGDYLVAPYGFTSERRYVYVLDAHSGKVIQKLPVIENICPSKSWAPNWHPGERCDAPGQAVGAATAPRVEDGFFLVDTNTGSSLFHFK